MKLYLYAIKDAKSTFMQPMADQNDATAIRNFQNACRQPGSLLASHPNDFALWNIGWFDNETGLLCDEGSGLIYDAAHALQEVLNK